MAKRIPGIRIVGGEHDKVAAATEQVADKQEISVGTISIQCIETAFHTQGHICYLCSEEGTSEKLIFTGDTLFIGGCGRWECQDQIQIRPASAVQGTKQGVILKTRQHSAMV